MRYAINKVWNDDKHILALAATVPDGYSIRRRGRGHRFGQRSYWQSLPLNLSAYFTQYSEPKGYSAWKDGFQDIVQADFVGFTPENKPIIRLRVPK